MSFSHCTKCSHAERFGLEVDESTPHNNGWSVPYKEIPPKDICPICESKMIHECPKCGSSIDENDWVSCPKCNTSYHDS